MAVLTQRTAAAGNAEGLPTVGRKFGYKETAVSATGQAVPKDINRRKEAEAVDAKKGVDRPLQLVCVLGVLLPHAWAYFTQEAPTVPEQLGGWLSTSYQQLIDGCINFDFQLAAALLFIERICYTWVHSFSASFVCFCGTRLGRAMGHKPLDTVLTIFYINKCIQFGTFFVWYFYKLGFQSPWAVGFTFAGVTRFQWVLLSQGLVMGQGLNIAIYRAIGKRGVYYGYRLGEPVPWVTGFPFSVMPHPQYGGVCAFVIGVNAFAALPIHVESGWFNLTAIQVLYYAYMAAVEDYL